MLRLLRIAWIATLAATAATHAEEPTPFPIDPVELREGRETPGLAEITADHYRYRYCFATEANRAEFLKNPTRYEIQMGGACARMGPLSGVGRPDFYAMHNGALYLFASPQCRQAFLADPAKFLESDEPRPAEADNPDAVRMGRELIEKAVAAHGGGERIDAVQSVQRRTSRKTKYQDELVDNGEVLTIAFPDRVRVDQTWGEQTWTSVARGDSGWFSGGELRPMHAQQRRAMRTEHGWRHLLSVLKARNDPDVALAYLGPATVQWQPRLFAVSEVALWRDGATTVLGIDPKTGLVHRLRYRGRGPRMSFGKLENIFWEYADCDGIRLPERIYTRFDDAELPSDASEIVTQSVNLSDVDALFREP